MVPKAELKMALADMTAKLVEGHEIKEDNNIFRVVSVRMPIELVANCQALADQAQVTRNILICKLIEIGVQEVESRLSSETLLQISLAEESILVSYLGEEI